MKTFLKFITGLEKLGATLAALSLALMFGLGLAEILSRGVAGFSLPVSLEYSGYLVAFSFFLGLGWTLSEGKHIRLALFSGKLSPGGEKLLEFLAVLFSLAVSSALTIGLIAWAWGSYTKGAVSYFPSATPLWIPQMIFAIGPLILSFSLLGRLLGFKTKDPGE